MYKKIEFFLACFILSFLVFVFFWDGLGDLFKGEPVSKIEIIEGGVITRVYKTRYSICYIFEVRYQKDGIEHVLDISDTYSISKWTKARNCQFPPTFKEGEVVNLKVFFQKSILGYQFPRYADKLP